MPYNDAVDHVTIRPLLLGVLLVTVAAATYAGALHGAFQYDDLFTILLKPGDYEYYSLIWAVKSLAS